MSKRIKITEEYKNRVCRAYKDKKMNLSVIKTLHGGSLETIKEILRERKIIMRNPKKPKVKIW